MTEDARRAREPARRRRGGIRRWVLRALFFGGWLAAVLLSLVLLIGGAGWWISGHPEQAAKLGIDMIAPGSGLAVEGIELRTDPRDPRVVAGAADGVVVLRGVTLDSGAGGEAVRLEEVRVYYSRSGFSLIDSGRVEEVVIDGGRVVIDDRALARWMPPEDAESAADVNGDGAKPVWLARVIPDRVSLQNVDVSVALGGVPKVSGTVGFESKDFAKLISGDTEGGIQRVVLGDGAWTAEGEEVPVAFEELELEVVVSDKFGKIDIRKASVAGLRAQLTPDGLAEFLSPSEDKPAGGEPPEISIGTMRVTDAELSFHGFENLPDVSARADFEIAGLRLAGGRLRSAEEQGLVLRGTEIKAPGATGGALLKWDLAELRAVPDALLESGEVAKLRVRGLAVDVSKETLGDLLEMVEAQRGTGSDEGVAATGSVSKEGGPHAIVVRDLSVEGADLRFDPAGLFDGLPAVVSKLEMRSEDTTPDGDVSYGLELSEIAVKEKSSDSKPFASGSKLVATFRALGLQRDGLIDSVKMSGVRAEIGEAVQRLAEAATPATPAAPDGAQPDPVAAPDPEPAAPADPDDGGDDEGPGLSVAKLEIVDTTITLRDLVPGALPYLTIGLDTSLENVPVQGRSRGDEREQRIELKGLQIASPYNSLQNVAELKTVWIYFTIPGLFRNEIRRVEIVSPDVYVGEPLFWYIDYARKYAAAEPLDGEPVAAGPEGKTGDEGEAGENDAIVKGLKNFKLSGWRLGEIEVHAGRIIIAPTGIPLGIVPFPFEAKTDFAKGEISLKIEVPTGDYVFEELELELRRLAGEAWVNYPVAGVNNNFVQKFESPAVKFQQFEGSDVWLSVTYNEAGIYGEMGGKAYDGYVNGGFNIYVKESFRWEAWVSGTEFNLGEFTNVLAPESFLMSGIVDGKFVAEGQEIDLRRATADMKTRGGGTMHVLKLDDLREALPEDWEPLWKALANAGIDAFRNYDFESGEAELQYEGWEGDARVLFEGDEGRRDLKLRLFDRRGERAAIGDADPP